MLDLLYVLDALIPNFGDMIEGIGGILLIFGLLDALLGYKKFKIMLAITGFLTGATAGFLIFFYNGNGIADSDAIRIYMLIGGIIGAALAGTFHKVGVFLTVGALSAIVFLFITQSTFASLLLGTACGIAGVFIEKYIIIITTAFSGGSLAAMGLWMIGIASGSNMNFPAMSLTIGIGGLVFQLWLERRRPTEAVEGIDIGEIILIVVTLIGFIGKGLGNLIKNPKETVQKFVGKKDSDQWNTVMICLSLGAPIIIGTIQGILFRSFILGLAGIAALYILWMALYVKKRKAEALPGGYMPKDAWEVWLNKVMDSQTFLIFSLFLMPFFPGFFILGVTASLTDNDGIILLTTISAIVGVFVVWFKILGSLPPKEAAVSHKDGEEEIDRQQKEGVEEPEVEPKEEPDTPDKISMTACPVCGEMIDENANFCVFCGEKNTRKG